MARPRYSVRPWWVVLEEIHVVDGSAPECDCDIGARGRCDGRQRIPENSYGVKESVP